MIETQYFKYGEKEIQWLKEADPQLAKVIDEIGHIKRAVIPDLFTGLLHAIVGQQIATKAQETIWSRILERFSPLTPETIDKISAEELQAVGITMRKATYIKEIAHTIVNESLDLDELSTLEDEDVSKRLLEIKGVGIWTAEMLMTFSMQRMNIMSWGDLAIHRGLRMLYGHHKITPELFKKYKKRYSPYASVASLYLWEISKGTYLNLVDPASKTQGPKRSSS